LRIPWEYIASGWGASAIGDPLIFGSRPGALYVASPPGYIAKTPNTDPPFLILQGDKDNTVPPIHSLKFYDDLLNAGQPAILQMVQNAGHEFLLRGTAITPPADQISAMMIQFFLKYLTGGVPTTLSPVPFTSFSNPLPEQAFLALDDRKQVTFSR
jgi:prolyl oligopeptidase PreP (S9A serine peptidase family)